MNPERWEQIKEIYESAPQFEASQREAFLKDACAGDDSMRREVESLLACQPEAAKFIEQPAVEVAAKAMAHDRRQDMVGRELVAYRIVSFIGAGGMGEVYH